MKFPKTYKLHLNNRQQDLKSTSSILHGIMFFLFPKIRYRPIMIAAPGKINRKALVSSKRQNAILAAPTKVRSRLPALTLSSSEEIPKRSRSSAHQQFRSQSPKEKPAHQANQSPKRPIPATRKQQPQKILFARFKIIPPIFSLKSVRYDFAESLPTLPAFPRQ